MGAETSVRPYFLTDSTANSIEGFKENLGLLSQGRAEVVRRIKDCFGRFDEESEVKLMEKTVENPGWGKVKIPVLVAVQEGLSRQDAEEIGLEVKQRDVFSYLRTRFRDRPVVEQPIRLSSVLEIAVDFGNGNIIDFPNENGQVMAMCLKPGKTITGGMDAVKGVLYVSALSLPKDLLASGLFDEGGWLRSGRSLGWSRLMIETYQQYPDNPKNFFIKLWNAVPQLEELHIVKEGIRTRRYRAKVGDLRAVVEAEEETQSRRRITVEILNVDAGKLIDERQLVVKDTDDYRLALSWIESRKNEEIVVTGRSELVKWSVGWKKVNVATGLSQDQMAILTAQIRRA